MTSDDTLVKTLLVVIGAVFLLPLLAMLLMMPMMGTYAAGHMAGGTWDGTAAAWTWPLMTVVTLLVVLGVGYLLYRGLRSPGDGRTDPTLEEVRVGYARGELSEEEFEERRARLRRED